MVSTLLDVLTGSVKIENDLIRNMKCQTVLSVGTAIRSSIQEYAERRCDSDAVGMEGYESSKGRGELESGGPIEVLHVRSRARIDRASGGQERAMLDDEDEQAVS